MTHRFFNFKDLRKRESQKAPDNIYDRAYYEADMKVLEMFEQGRPRRRDRRACPSTARRTRRGTSATT